MEELSEPQIKNSKLSFLWILPILALLGGLYMAYSKISNLGPEIEIRFKTAEGLEAGRTKIRYRSLDIGTVRDIVLTDGMDGVIVKAQMTKTAEKLLKEGTQFWVVKPQIGISGISGFNTLLSGSFIAVSRANSKVENNQIVYSFEGLNEPPLVPSQVPGLRVKLIASSNKGLHYGSPVYYRGFRVGRIDRIAFDDTFHHVEIEAFITEPYDKLINDRTKFWNVSGLNVKLGAGGVEVDMQSPETVLLGGITFSTPEGVSNETKLSENKVFNLFSSENDINPAPRYKKQYFVAYFNDSVRGLKVGSTVEFNGIEIGKVVDITLIYDDKTQLAMIPVLLELEPARIKQVNHTDAKEENILYDLIKHGLVANLDNANLITGTKFVRLSVDLSRETDNEITVDKYSQYTLMPTKDTGISGIVDDVSQITNKIKNLPFEDLILSAQRTMNSVEKALSTKEIEEIGKSINKSLKQVDATLSSINSAGKNADKMLKNLNNEISKISNQLQHTIKGANPESSLYYTLNETLKSLQRMSNSVDRLMKQLDAKPNSLILGD